MSLKFINFAAAAAVLAMTPAAAWAVTPVGPGTNDGSIVVNAFNFVPQVVGTYSAPVVDSKTTSSSSPPTFSPGTSTVTAGLTVANSPTPAIFTNAQFDLTGVAGGQGSAQDITHYSFQVGGAASQAQVFISATGNAGFTAGSSWANGAAFVEFRVQQQFNGPVIIDDTLDLVSSSAGQFVDEITDPHHFAPNPFVGFSVAQNFTLLTNTIYDVTLRAQVGGSINNTTGGVSQSIFANIDPTFAVDGPFTFDVSPGFGGFTVNNPAGPGVPEPAAWALMLLGFAGVGAAVRRGRRALIATA